MCEYYLRVLSPGLDPNIDLVAVHGLNPKSKQNHAEKTWESNGKLWLRDFLPRQLPRARIFLFSYNSKVAIQSSAAGVREQAHNLLERLRLERESCESRPLLFIAHSLGGIVVKEALVQAKLSVSYGSICTSTFGITFFGTPHRGTHLARVGGVAAKLVRTILGSSSNTLLKALTKGNLYSRELSSNFDKLLENYQYLSFYETLSFKSIGIIVEKESAILGLPDSREKTVALNADHEEICRFSCDEDDNYQYVSSLIVELATSATEKRTVLDCSNESDSTLIENDVDSSFFMLPYARNPGFVSRENISRQLMERLMPLGKVHSRVALYGLGGVGKSQLAIELAHQMHVAYPDVSIFWIHANTIDRFKKGYDDILNECGIGDQDGKENSKLLLVRKWLEKQCKRWLLIIDNADQASLFTSGNHLTQSISKAATPSEENQSILEYIPESSYGSVLITTRNRAAGVKFTKGVAQNMVEVGTMTQEQSKCLLESVLSEDYSTKSEMDDLAGLLDCLPLAMMQAASFMQENVLTVNEYIKLHKNSDETTMNLLCEPFETLGRDSETPNALATTLIISLGHIKSHEQKAIDALCLIAFLDQYHIPESLVQQKFDTVLDSTRALGVLKAFSLIIPNGGGHEFSIHRLVQLTVRKWLLIEQKFHDKAIEAMDILAEVYPNAEFENWVTCATYLPHALSVLNFIPELHGKPLRRRLYLQEGIAYYLWSQDRPDEAETLDVLIVEENKKEFGMEHPETLESIAGLSSTYSSQNRLAEAEELDLLLIATRKKVFGPNDPMTLTSMLCLVGIYRRQYRFQEAESLGLDVLERAKSVFGEGHGIFIDALGHLGKVYSDQGRWQEAEEFSLKYWNWHKDKFGPEHPWSLSIADSITTIYVSQKRLQEGKELAAQTLRVCEEHLGPDHPTTRNCKQVLIHIYIDLEDWKSAEGLSLEVFEEDLRAHGPTHIETLEAKQQLSNIYWKMGNAEKVEELDGRIIDDCLHKFGSDHVYTLKFTALARRHQGEDAEAIKLMARTVNKQEVLLGPFHNDTLDLLHELRTWCEPKQNVVDILLEAEREAELLVD
ncbi:kinesin [Aspergillus ellipticus CBS 707.79]|uniref:Kinesin n=1 Tax=Aspergillus ellipticus CBS 707.79 TaxID=1448320 RepID=A0A319DJN5_9EURO|nr:kinesin [Aspergillus ellipticus CBS 707.79]